MQVTIRPATFNDASAIAQVQLESWKTTYPGIVPDHALAALSHDNLRQRAEAGFANPAIQTFVAEAAGNSIPSNIFGFICGGPTRNPQGGYALYDAELYALYLLQSHQQQGAGRALVQALARTLQAQNYKSLLVWALQANPAVEFYKHLGALPLALTTINIGGQDLPDLALGWPSLNQLLVY